VVCCVSLIGLLCFCFVVKVSFCVVIVHVSRFLLDFLFGLVLVLLFLFEFVFVFVFGLVCQLVCGWFGLFVGLVW